MGQINGTWCSTVVFSSIPISLYMHHSFKDIKMSAIIKSNDGKIRSFKRNISVDKDEDRGTHLDLLMPCLVIQIQIEIE